MDCRVLCVQLTIVIDSVCVCGEGEALCVCVGGRLCVCVGVYVWEAVCVGRVYMCGESVCVWEALCVYLLLMSPVVWP